MSVHHQRYITLTGIGLVVAVLATVFAREASAQCQRQRVTPSDAVADEYFGTAIAVGKDLVIVGKAAAASETGAAYIFRFDGSSWVEEQKLLASDAAEGDRFGSAIAATTDLIAVAAQSDQDAGYATGSVYLFRFDGTTWLEEQKLVAGDAQAGDLFGASLAIEGERVAVGAPGQDEKSVSAGAIYVFSKAGGSWLQEAKLLASDGEFFDELGWSVGLSGSMLVAGAPGHNNYDGAAYVYQEGPTGWSEVQKLTPSQPTGDFGSFGSTGSLDGEVALIGAPRTVKGEAYVFRQSGGLFIEEAQLTASDGAQGDVFAGSLAVSGDAILIGAHGDDDKGSTSGSAYLFRFDGAAWHEEAKLVASDGKSTDRFAYAVALDGVTAASGAPWDDDPRNSGSAYVFALDAVRAAWSNYGQGWPGTGGIPDLTVNARPVLGSTVTLLIDNSYAPNPTTAMLFLGLAAASIDTPLGGTLLVTPGWIVTLAMPGSSSLSLPGTIPLDPALSGLHVFLQVLENDPGASNGVSFTPGLDLLLGEC
ncbi:MAG: hypothetical protein AB1486_08295 [Planctomycetota bacterium]